MGKFETHTWSGPPVFGAGRAARKPCRYDAYLPDPLAERAVALTPDAAAAVSDAERAIQRLNDETPTVTNLESLARLLLRAESVASSRIEGLQVGPRRLIRAEGARAMGVAADDLTAETVLGNIRAMQLAVDTVATADRLTLDHVLDIHRTLMPELGGQIREQQSWIGGNDYNPCGADFVPPPPPYVPALLDDLVAFMNGEGYPPLVQAALAHAQFETIHPFTDGNGRTGRALIHVVLKRRGLAPRYVPPVSLVLATRSRDYVRGLTAFRFLGPPDAPDGQSGAAEWIGTFAAAAARATVDAERLGAQLEQLAQRWREQAAPFRAKSAIDLLLRALPGTPVLTGQTAAQLIGREGSLPNARAAIDRLVAAGVLTQVTVGRRNRAFEAVGLAEILTDFERSLATPGGDTRVADPIRAVPARRQPPAPD